MRTLYLILIIIAAPILHADEITKWIDEDGNVHYGDKKAVTDDAVEVEKLKVDDSFDQQSYDDAMQRNAETEKALEEYQTEREEKEQREREEAAMNRPAAPPAGGGTAVINPPAIYPAPGYPNRPGTGIGNRPRPAPLPANPGGRR